MKSIKQGRAGSLLGGIFGLIFAIVTAAMAVNAGRSNAGVLFVLVPALMSLMGLIASIFAIANALAKKRFSVMDILEDGEEDDPLNERFDEKTLYCPHCGEKIRADFAFCPECGGKTHDAQR